MSAPASGRDPVSGLDPVAGIDEVGRGPLAGPVVAAVVVLPEGFALPGLRDSKKLSAAAREKLDLRIRADALDFAIGEASVAEIDALNILQATFLAMRRAYEALRAPPACVRVDGNRLPPFLAGLPYAAAIVGGDDSVPAISAASVVAKVHRDRLMAAHAARYPLHGFERHKGYGTAAHLAALARHGVTPLHRRSFAPVHTLLAQGRLWAPAEDECAAHDAAVAAAHDARAAGARTGSAEAPR